MSTWNQSLEPRAASRRSTRLGPRHGDGDLVNQVFFDSNYYGTSFGRDTLAITTRWTLNSTQRVEADIVFNTAFTWDSYRGNVALERRLGHSPRRPARVRPRARSRSSRRERPERRRAHELDPRQPRFADRRRHRRRAVALRRAGVAGNITFPPRNEPNDFFNQLLARLPERAARRAVADVCGSGRRGDLADRIRAAARRPVRPRRRRRRTRSTRSRATAARWSARSTPVGRRFRSRRATKACCS